MKTSGKANQATGVTETQQVSFRDNSPFAWTVEVRVVLPGSGESGKRERCDLEKVMRLRQQLREGTYAVSPDTLADALFRHAGRITARSLTGYPA